MFTGLAIVRTLTTTTGRVTIRFHVIGTLPRPCAISTIFPLTAFARGLDVRLTDFGVQRVVETKEKQYNGALHPSPYSLWNWKLILRSLCHLIKHPRALDVNLTCIRFNIQILSHILRITTGNQVTHLNYYFQKQTRVSLITLNS